MRKLPRQNRFFTVQAGLILISLASCATGDLVNYQDTPIDLARDTDPVPMKLSKGEDGSGYVTIPLSFNGTIKECMIDTGSPSSHVFSADPFFESLPETGRTWLWGMTGEKTAAFVVEAKTLGVGGTVLGEIDFIRHDETPAHILGYPCIVGMNVLSHGVVRFNFRKKTFQLLKEFPADLKKESLTVFSTGHFGIPLQIGTLRLKTLFDTGASITFLESEVIIVSSTGFKIPIYELTGASFGNKPILQKLVGAASGNLADNAQFDAVAGFNLIQDSNWIIDVHSRTWANF